MITWYRCGQSTFSSCNHIGGQRKAKMDKKHHRTKAPKDKTQNRQNPQKRKYFNTPTIKVYDPMITWYRCGQLTFSSCDHVGRQRKAKMDKSTIRQKNQRIKLKADKTPKRENILILQQSRCMIPFLFMWSHDTGVDNQHSCHAIMWVDREKPKWTKAHRTKVPNDKTQSGQNLQKRKYFNTPTIKVYDPMFTWYTCGQSTFSSCNDVGLQRKAKMD